ncbi:hypothetical protein P691DRAFT_757294 [Macrolepiota fuliginosa MF-IS2]|uniref:DUF6534 domain-containing protein n=1 Tax=Macrolepiota fuliginosa MF-IS2 TaxID=1400762 RepID=A0A9P6C731_9AGAR|nr:hypothetical protein P691DRAFT_757294 [Macrolepiota fuliginosa MF-IS2]
MIAITLANTFGALEVGTLVAVFLFGIITLQAEFYFREFPEDNRWLKGTVLMVWLLEVGHTIGICVEVYRTTILFAGHPLEYNNFTGLGSATLLGGVITMVVQSFFSHRLWRLLPNPFRYLGLLFIIVSVARCGFSTYLAHQAITATSLPEYTAKTSWLIRMLLSVGAAFDILIAVAMLYFFAKKRKGALQHTTRVVDRLLGLTIRTGLLTSITAVAVLICFQIAPHTYIWAGVYCCLAKLYSNSFLSALNERQELRKTMGTSGVVADNNSSDLDRLTRRKVGVATELKGPRHLIIFYNSPRCPSP